MPKHRRLFNRMAIFYIILFVAAILTSAFVTNRPSVVTHASASTTHTPSITQTTQGPPATAIPWLVPPETPQASPPPSTPSWPKSYTVQGSDTLGSISAAEYGTSNDWTFIWQANKASIKMLPDGSCCLIFQGQQFILPAPDGPVPPGPVSSTPAPVPSPAVSASTPAPTGSVYSASQIAALWIAQGGSSARVSVAVCIAEHESGGRTDAVSPTNDFGLWQIHNNPAALNPVTSAIIAISMSANGTNWGPWTTAGMCGV